MPTDVLNLRALNRALLARQMLLEPSPLPEGPGRAGAVIGMVEHLAGLQAAGAVPAVTTGCGPGWPGSSPVTWPSCWSAGRWSGSR